ncbi:putative efflux system inner membrane protein [Pseudomonas psychrotolerans L19]|uniref:efflux RND transporter periplasmic adaptor subunit n=1 Tax=Pseudomonas TaxID=286 RepID=UPI00023A1384|nr:MULTISPECIES: efflux RND transporter periplasmic adaptor subunit [Pseudomonas]EHK68902.1 putative efflux system inner membrane protein [Pseudomonas psychrotolerans L19]MBA1181907.1 efflux RND transporter periplasmic adaptor subunit [Pseudomonas psychrotolerans]TCQ88750.1 membrane fusion protein (multidrug efflux system) [Pseudomonas sp. JUb52]
MSLSRPALGSLALLCLLLAACDRPAPEAAAPPAPRVQVETLHPTPLAIASELSGRLVAPRTAEVRARVAGIVLQRVFREGSEVKAGEVLFRIDPAPLQAEVDSAAALRKAEASAFQARRLAERYAALVESEAISRQAQDDARGASLQAQAEVAAAQAALKRARLNLGYATVTTPIAGRIGKALVSEGALVGQGDATPLAIIQQLDPIQADVTQSTRQLKALRDALRDGRLQQVAPDQAQVTLLQEDGSPYPESGRLLFADLAVDASTGQITLRSQFPNPRRELLPGSFVRVRLEQARLDQGLSVAQRAVQRSAGGQAQVWVVDAEDRLALREVRLGPVVEGRWVVESGLAAGERVLLSGLQQAQPGLVVAPQEAQAAPAEGR